MYLSEIIAGFVQKPAPFTSNALYLAKRSIIDSWGAMIIGADTECVHMAEKLKNGDGCCTIIGNGHKATPRDAAFINGISGHELELDDTSSSNLGHPTIVVIPPLLALAEERGCSGIKFLEAFLIATEVECKIGRIVAKELHRKGWHCSSVTGVIGVAAGCAYLIGLDKEKTCNAIGIAASMASGVRENFGTQTKSIHIGKCSEDGLRAAIMAEQGFTSSKVALEATEGYIFEYAGIRQNGTEFEDILLSMGHDWDICSPGFTLKRWPSCSSTHRPVDAIIDVLERDGIKADDIERIEAHLGISALRELVTPYPKNGEEAKFSIGFQIALYLHNLENMPYNYTESVIMMPEIQNIIYRTFMYEEVKYNNLPSDMGVGPADVKVITKDGVEHCITRMFPIGHLTCPISDEGLKEKFLTCSVKTLGLEKALSLYNILSKLEDCRDMKEAVAISY